MTYQDILFEAQDGVATITINRPQVMNAFRSQTCEESFHALNRAGWAKSIGVIVLTGAGDRVFLHQRRSKPPKSVAIRRRFLTPFRHAVITQHSGNAQPVAGKNPIPSRNLRRAMPRMAAPARDGTLILPQ